MLNLHVYPSPLTHESRILRITGAIAELGLFSRIDIVGVAGAGLPVQEEVDATRHYVRIRRRFGTGRDGLASKMIKSVEWSLRVLVRYRREPVACVNAHSLAVLPLCWALATMTGSRLVYDTHELETETSGNRGLRQKLGKWVERTLISRADHVFVVSDSIRDWYVHQYAIKPPTTIRNLPVVEPPTNAALPPAIASLPIPQDATRFIYQGGFIAGRGIERLLQTFAAAPSSHLILMGSGPLREVVQAASERHPNIHLLPPVPPNEVLQYTRAAQVGVCLTENSCLSHYYSLPNKVFEYLHAGLPILVNPLWEQEKLVRQYRCGWVAPEDPEKLLALLNTISPAEISSARVGVKQAQAALNWNFEKALIVDAYRGLFA